VCGATTEGADARASGKTGAAGGLRAESLWLEGSDRSLRPLPRGGIDIRSVPYPRDDDRQQRKALPAALDVAPPRLTGATDNGSLYGRDYAYPLRRQTDPG